MLTGAPVERENTDWEASVGGKWKGAQDAV